MRRSKIVMPMNYHQMRARYSGSMLVRVDTTPGYAPDTTSVLSVRTSASIFIHHRDRAKLSVFLEEVIPSAPHPSSR